MSRDYSMKPSGWILYVNKNEFVDCNIAIIEGTNHAQSCLQPMNVFTSDNSLKKIAYSLLATPRHASKILTGMKIGGNDVIAKKYILQNSGTSGIFGELILLVEHDINSFELKRFFKDEIQAAVSGKVHKKIKQKTKDIVKMIALGLDRDEVSELFNLSHRGVDYHLDVAKEALGATNKSSMVFQAVQQGWLVSHQQALQ